MVIFTVNDGRNMANMSENCKDRQKWRQKEEGMTSSKVTVIVSFAQSHLGSQKRKPTSLSLPMWCLLHLWGQGQCILYAKMPLNEIKVK